MPRPPIVRISYIYMPRNSTRNEKTRSFPISPRTYLGLRMDRSTINSLGAASEYNVISLLHSALLLGTNVTTHAVPAVQRPSQSLFATTERPNSASCDIQSTHLGTARKKNMASTLSNVARMPGTLADGERGIARIKDKERIKVNLCWHMRLVSVRTE